MGFKTWLRRYLPKLKLEASLGDIEQDNIKRLLHTLYASIFHYYSLVKPLRCLVLFLINLSLPICSGPTGNHNDFAFLYRFLAFASEDAYHRARNFLRIF